MATIGYVLSHEQFTAPQLLEFAAQAERAGFDALWTSDHFHPWMDNQGHAGQAWVTLAALGQRVGLPFGTTVHTGTPRRGSAPRAGHPRGCATPALPPPAPPPS